MINKITHYKAKKREDIEAQRIKAVMRVAIVPALKEEIKKLEERGKRITKRETDKIQERLNTDPKLTKFGQLRVVFGPAGHGINDRLTVDLSVTENVKKSIGHRWSLDIFDVRYQTPKSYTPNAIPWCPEYPDYDLTVQSDAEYLSNYEQLIEDYNRIDTILKKREEAIEDAIKKADKLIPSHMHAALESFTQ